MKRWSRSTANSTCRANSKWVLPCQVTIALMPTLRIWGSWPSAAILKSPVTTCWSVAGLVSRPVPRKRFRPWPNGWRTCRPIGCATWPKRSSRSSATSGTARIARSLGSSTSSPTGASTNSKARSRNISVVRWTSPWRKRCGDTKITWAGPIRGMAAGFTD